MTTWRVGKKLGRTLYRDEVCVGLVDTPGLALEIVEALNRPAPKPESDVAALKRLTNKEYLETSKGYLTTAEAAELLGISKKGLEGLRMRGAGPPYIRIGRVVRYPIETITQTRGAK